MGVICVDDKLHLEGARIIAVDWREVPLFSCEHATLREKDKVVHTVDETARIVRGDGCHPPQVRRDGKASHSRETRSGAEDGSQRLNVAATYADIGVSWLDSEECAGDGRASLRRCECRDDLSETAKNGALPR